MKFEKNSVVTIKSGLEVGKWYGKRLYTSQINSFRGKKMKVLDFDHGDKTYLLDLTRLWVGEEMLEQAD